MKICRCCQNKLTANPVLEYHNMPGRAQNFPEKGCIDQDMGVSLILHQCPNCGLVQLSNEPVDYYRDVIRAVAVSEEMKDFRLNYFKAFVERFHLSQKKIIEIGAGCGEFMEIMVRENVDVYGLENKEESVLAGQKKGLKIIRGYIEHADTRVEGAPFDAFYIMNFLEHIPDPNIFLQGIAANLTEDGVGLVEVPNMNFFLEKHLFAEFMLDHLSYFTTDTLTLLLEKNGFEVIECETVWKNYVISAYVKKRKGTSFKDFIVYQDNLIGEIRSFVEKRKALGLTVAVWGAGHEALALLAMADLEDTISFVADSAPFKQGKYTPASHIPVVSPDEIENHNINAVLVMAGSYTREVLKLLKERYPNVEAAAVELDRVITL